METEDELRRAGSSLRGMSRIFPCQDAAELEVTPAPFRHPKHTPLAYNTQTHICAWVFRTCHSMRSDLVLGICSAMTAI